MPYNWSRFVSSDRKTVTVLPIKIEHSIAEYHDARSAAFFAMGMSIKEREPITLLLPGEYLTNVYTALTEAWFQKAEMIVYAFHKKVSDVKTSWAHRCAKTITIHIDEYEEKADEITAYHHMHGPVLINVVGIDLEEPQIDYSAEITAISEVDKLAKFLCYNSKELTVVSNIKAEYKYGVLSKYIGMSITKNVGYLLCNSNCMLVDVNVFRTRYANGNMKIVVLDDGLLKENQIDKWIISNGWKCKRTEQMNHEAAKWLKDQNVQAILIIG